MSETTTPKKISNKTYEQVKAERKAILDEFVDELERMQNAGMSLRQIGEMKKINYETARKLLKKNETSAMYAPE